MRLSYHPGAAMASRSFVLAVLLMLAASATLAQKKNKNQPPPPDPNAQAMSLPPGDEIEHDIGEMLGALQVGNIEEMHKYYSDNATFVNSVYGMPIIGWQSWAAGYERQKAAFRGMQVVRRNTLIFPHGDVAWATYQWEFSGIETNGAQYAARGQTTLVLNRVGNNWLIVHNHTSVDCGSVSDSSQKAPAAPAAAPTTPPRQ
jgi:ketosteroid isomerase-like protein